MHPLLALAQGLPDNHPDRAHYLHQFQRLQIREQIAACTNCDLRNACRRPVPFSGPTPNLVAFVGEAPGPDEDAFGQPFWPDAPAGRLFADLLRQHLGWPRDQAFVMNLNSCFPGWQEGRLAAPTLDQSRACMVLAKAQLDLCSPAVVVLQGFTALRLLFGPGTTVEKARKHGPVFHLGRWWFPTYHPSWGVRDKKNLNTLHSDWRQLSALVHKVWTDRCQSVLPMDSVRNRSYEEIAGELARMFREHLVGLGGSPNAHDVLVLMARLVARAEANRSPDMGQAVRAFYDDKFLEACGVSPTPVNDGRGYEDGITG